MILVFISPANAQGAACVPSTAVPESAPPENVDVLTRTFGTLILQRLGSDPLKEDVLGIVAIRGTQNVLIFIMKSGFACRFPLVPVELYERAKRLVLGVEG